jgi:hypothetical protein
MRSWQSLLVLVWLVALVACCASQASTRVDFARPAASSRSFLPKSFAGWNMLGAPTLSTEAAAADRVNRALLKEYGFKDFEAATYVRDDGRRLTLRAARFEDASGALGAFTFYRTPEMLDEQIGDRASSLNQRVLFYRGDILVDAVFQRLSAMSAAELRELADELPRPSGAAANLPSLLGYMPMQAYVKNTLKYVLGPIGLESLEAPLPTGYVDFSKGAEVVVGQYSLSGKTASLVLIGYPTPQIAAAELAQIEAAEKSHGSAEDQIAVRRTGPLVILAAGPVSAADRRSLASEVNYEADVTWNEKTSLGGRDNVGTLIVTVILLAAVICGLSIVTGLAFGGFRLAVQRLFPGKVFDRPEQVEIISLHLSDGSDKPADSDLSSSIKAG